MIRKRFQGMAATAANTGETRDLSKGSDEGFRVSEVAENMAAASMRREDGGLHEAQGSTLEKSYVRTRKRPHRKLRLFDDDDDDDAGVIGEGFKLQDGQDLQKRGSGCEVDSQGCEGKGKFARGFVASSSSSSQVGPTGEVTALAAADGGENEAPAPTVIVSAEEGLIGQGEAGVEDGGAERKISMKLNGADVDEREERIGGFNPLGKKDESDLDERDDGSPEFRFLGNNNEADVDDGSAVSHSVKKDEVDVDDGSAAELGLLGKMGKADVDDRDDGSAGSRLLEKKNEAYADERDDRSAEPNHLGKMIEADMDDSDNGSAGFRILRKKREAGVDGRDDGSAEFRHLRKNNVADVDGMNERVAEFRPSMKENEAEMDDMDDKIAEFSLSRKKSEAHIDGGDNGSAELWLSKKNNEADVNDKYDKSAKFRKKNDAHVDDMDDRIAEFRLPKKKNEVDLDGRDDGSARILRKRRRVVDDDVDVREDVNAKLERKRRRLLDDNADRKKEGGSALIKQLRGVSKSDRQSLALEGKKLMERKVVRASNIESLKGDVHGHKTSGNSAEVDIGKKFVKKSREIKTERLPMGSKKIDHRMSNGAAIESLKQGILLVSNAGDSSRDGPIQRNKSGTGVRGSSVMDDHESKSTLRLKKSRIGAVFPKLESNSLDRDSLRNNKLDVQRKRNAVFASPKNDSASALHKQKKLLKNSPPLQKEIKIAKERKSTMPSLVVETSRMKTPSTKETKAPEPSFAKESKSMRRNARSEERKRLRERLRDALLAAGWKIDLRPRKGKNYDDNVYISPSGTSFWSLPKAWNALTQSLGQNSGIDEGISGSLKESKEVKTSEQVNRGSGGEGSGAHILATIVCNEDLSLLKRKRRKVMEDNEKRNGIMKKMKKDQKRMKGQESSHKVDSDGMNLSDVKSKDEKKQRDKNTNKIKKDGKRVKIQKTSRKVDSDDGISLSDVKSGEERRKAGSNVKAKEKKQKLKSSGSDAITPNSKVLEKSNMNDKTMHPTPGHLKRKLHADSERKQSTSKAVSNVVKYCSSQVKKNKSRKGGCGLLVRSSGKGDRRSGEQGVSVIAKRTVISWLIDAGAVPENECVQYWNKKGTRVMLEGWVQRDGILCECCNKVISVSMFEDHAGATRHHPFENIYLQSGKSLIQCLREAWDTQDESRKCGKSIIEVDEEDKNDDTCGLCGDGGDLICCDKCPSTFHQVCLELKDLPAGDWYCLNCTCQICGTIGHVGEIPSGKMTDVLFCGQCEHEYHKKCLQEGGIQIDHSILNNSSFCGKACEKVYVGLHHLLGISNPLGGGFSWTLLKRYDDDQEMSSCQGLSLDRMAECNAKLAVAHVVMDECFMPIVDKRTNIDMVSNVVFSCWSNFYRLNYQGFYTAVLEKDDELVSVASIRVHGARLAEMPLIGTRHHYRRQGMCRRLVNAIEKMLLSLEVEKLILPAVPELLQTWTMAFGFNPLEDSHKNEIRHLNLMVFPGTDLLQKQICNQEMPI